MTVVRRADHSVPHADGLDQAFVVDEAYARQASVASAGV
jgi:hypothetical protein